MSRANNLKKVSNMKHNLILMAVIAFVVSLTGCGGGGSNNSQPSSDAKTVMKIGNDSPFDFASVTVHSTNGTVNYYDGQFKCVKTDTKCYLNINQDINESVTLLFKDSAGKLVRAVIVADVPGTYISLYPSAMDTGFYLMLRIANDLKATNNLSWFEVNDRVQTFFTNYDSPDGSLDPYEEVGDYYTSQLIKGVASESAFLSAFEQRLLNWDIAQNDELPKLGAQYANLYQRLLALFKPRESAFIGYAYAQEASCGTGLTTFLNFTENLASAIPVVGDAVAGAAAIGNSYCDDTDAKLDKIMSQLNALQNSVNLVDGKLTAIGAFVFDTETNRKTTEFQKLADKSKRLVEHYKNFLKDNNVSSLDLYFKNKGGWDQALAAGDSALKYILGAVYKDPSSSLFVDTLDTTNNADFQSYLAALKSRCATQPSSSKENFVLTRQQCNNIIQANTGRLVAAQGMMLPIVKDVYTVLNTYSDKAKNTYQRPPGSESYATVYSDIKAAFSQQQMTMVAAYKSKIGGLGYFNAFDGLDDGLIKSLVTRQCMQDGKDRVNGPAIIGWYAPDTNSKNNYIVTNCKIGSSSNRIVARYYYNDQGSVNSNDVANVLGVPVAYHYVSSGSPLYNSDANISKEDIEGWGTFQIESPSLVEVGAGSTGVIDPGSRDLYKKSTGLWETYGAMSYPHWILIPSLAKDELGKPLYHLVAKMYLKTISRERASWYTEASLTCVASPCRVDPGTGEWLIFYDGNSELRQTLDLRDTGKKTVHREGILRLAPVNQ
jgi:hypothetical protein